MRDVEGAFLAIVVVVAGDALFGPALGHVGVLVFTDELGYIVQVFGVRDAAAVDLDV